MTKEKKDEKPGLKVTAEHVHVAVNQVKAAIAKTGIAKDRKNDQQGYKFRGIDDVYNALAPIMAEASLNVYPTVLKREVVERTNQKGTALFYVTVEVRFDFVSAVDGSLVSVVTYGEAMDSGDKATNKAMSAALKYAFMQTFCIPTEGDNDADAQTHEVKPEFIDTEEAAQIDIALREIGADIPAYLKHIGAKSVPEIMKRDSKKAWNSIEVKRAAVAKKQNGGSHAGA